MSSQGETKEEKRSNIDHLKARNAIRKLHVDSCGCKLSKCSAVETGGRGDALAPAPVLAYQLQGMR